MKEAAAQHGNPSLVIRMPGDHIAGNMLDMRVYCGGSD